MSEIKKDLQKKIVVRLRRIEGQVRGVQGMIEAEADCGQILNQIAAIKSAVNQVGILMFENHARECILQAMSEDQQDERFQEIVKMMGRLIK
ncbi:MAG: metal-sensitive transcriptional regulator [Syntrophomonadaceae bacterium]|nr:metal-sensitive transcriptional regulator [Syntrophomonadaceae bacterium]